MDSIPSGRQSTVDYGLLLRRRGWVVVCGLVIGLVFAYVYLGVTPKSYRSTALVLVKATEADRGAVAGGRTSSPVNLDTESQLVRSAVVAGRAQKLLRSTQSPAELVSHVQVSVPANTSVLAIAYQAETANAALQGAHSFAEAYLQNRVEAAKEEIGLQVKSLKEQVAVRQNELEDWTGKSASLPSSSSDAAYADAQEKVILDQISELNRRLSPLVTADLNPGRIITDAQLPKKPSAPVPLLYAVSGLMAGLLFGMIVAVTLERIDRRVLRAEELEHGFGLPVLLKLRSGRRADARTAIPSPASPDGQEFHQLCHALIHKLGDKGRVVLVTGASGGAGTALVAAGLATALARRGSSVALVCADPLSPSAAWFDECKDRVPSRAAAVATRPAATEHNSVELPHLRVIAAGASGEDVSEMVQRGIAGEFFSALRASVRYVIVEAPPISVAVETLTLAEHADVALVVAEIPRTSRGEVRESIRRLGRVGLNVAGAAVLPSRRVKRQQKRRNAGERRKQPQLSPPAVDSAAVDSAAVDPVAVDSGNGVPQHEVYLVTPPVSTAGAVNERV